MFTNDDLIFDPKRKFRPPRCWSELPRRVVNTENFSEALEFLTRIIKEKKQAIIHGEEGVGKRTLIEITKRQVPKEIEFVHINPVDYKDDISAIRDIKEATAKSNRSVVILEDIELFCRQRQCFLYNVYEMSTKGLFSLIGLTVAQDCTEYLEKRVRSRLNASFYLLKFPYETSQEYVGFASKLTGDHRFPHKHKLELISMFSYGNRSIRELKKYLVDNWDSKDQKLASNRRETVEDNEDESDENDDPIEQLELPERSSTSSIDCKVESLTKCQRELLVVITAHCYESSSKKCGQKFTLMGIQDFALRKDLKSLALKVACSKEYLQNLSCLQGLSFVRAMKSKETLSAYAQFSLLITYGMLKDVIDRHPRWQSDTTRTLLRRR